MSPLSFIRAAWQDETRRQIVLIVVSAIALLLGFFDVTVSGIDLSWVAILLCGTPIVIEAAIGLITRFDVKADLLVSLSSRQSSSENILRRAKSPSSCSSARFLRK